MPRRRRAERREITPDAKFGDMILAKFINCVTKHGKKSTAERIVYGALNLIEKKAKIESLLVFKEAIKSVRPAVEVRSRRVGGATYQVPMEVRDVRSIALAIRWIIGSAIKRPEKTMMEKLCNELMDARNGRGASVKKRDDTHKMAEANRAFSHFRW